MSYPDDSLEEMRAELERRRQELEDMERLFEEERRRQEDLLREREEHQKRCALKWNVAAKNWKRWKDNFKRKGGVGKIFFVSGNIISVTFDDVLR
uniref:PH domain-containing protein n=1 Tax=Steinernema glaseri TaxID=37863 RepID=A0A1I7YLV9_9BILA